MHHDLQAPERPVMTGRLFPIGADASRGKKEQAEEEAPAAPGRLETRLADTDCHTLPGKTGSVRLDLRNDKF